jgi:thiamine kinase-like enzyme
MERRKGRLNIIEIVDEKTVRKIGIIREASRPYRLKVEAWVLSQVRQRGVNVPKVFQYSQNEKGQEVLLLERIKGKRLSQERSKKNAEIMFEVGSQLRLLRGLMEKQGWGWIDSTSMLGKFSDWRPFLTFYLQKYGNLLKDRGTLTEEELEKLFLSLDKIDFGEVIPSFVHRDIKPSNILIDNEGKVWILDWENTIIGDQLFDLAAFGVRYGEGEFWRNFTKGLNFEEEILSPRYQLYKILALVGVIDFYQKYQLSVGKKHFQLHRFIQQFSY